MQKRQTNEKQTKLKLIIQNTHLTLTLMSVHIKVTYFMDKYDAIYTCMLGI